MQRPGQDTDDYVPTEEENWTHLYLSVCGLHAGPGTVLAHALPTVNVTSTNLRMLCHV